MSDKKTKAKKRRGRNALTFYEKIAVIRHHEANLMSRNSLARMFQCCTTQIRRILERKDELLSQWQTMSETDASAIYEEMTKKRREFEMKAVRFILHQWVERCRHLQLNMIINNDTLKIVAIKMATVLNLSEFRPTARWLEKFRLKFKYKSIDLAKPRSAEDPQGTLSVEDIIIEYKHYLPSFMQQEIANITSNSLRDNYVSLQGSPTQTPKEEHLQVVVPYPFVTTKDCDCRENTNQSTNILPVENVLQYLSEIQQFLTLNEDYRAIVMATQLEDHLRTNYAHSELKADEGDVDRDDIILIE